MGCFFKVGVKTTGINTTATNGTSISLLRFGQKQGLYGAGLVGDIFIDAFHFGRVHKGTLHTNGFIAIEIEHVSPSNQLLGTGAVENGL